MAEITKLAIPDELADYRRRLIIYSESDPKKFRAEFNILFEALKEYDPVMGLAFDVGDTAVTVLSLRNEQYSVRQVIELVQPKFASYRMEPDSRMSLLSQPVNDKYYQQQWALRKMDAAAAWERVAQLAAPARVTVAILDSGLKADHEDLAGASLDGFRVIPPAASSFADDTGHGTMLAGAIAAIANNTVGIAGVARNVRIFSVKITDTRTPPTALSAVLGIVVALSAGAKVINASWHVLDDSSGLLRLAILLAGVQGCVFVAAAGNYGSNNTRIPTLPASYAFDNMIVAMASNRRDEKCWFSNYGSNVDLAAPGDRVISTGLYYVNPAYRETTGTSVAAAHVSAAAALLLCLGAWTPREIREHLVASASPSLSLRGTCRAHGRLDLRRAILGPFRVASPAGGEELIQGSAYSVRWASDYASPVVSSIDIFFIDSGTGAVLDHFGGQPNNGLATVRVPNQLTTDAVVRVKCGQKNVYADSKPFKIVKAPNAIES
jgi:thermitase